MNRKLALLFGCAWMILLSSSANATVTLTDFGNSGAGSFSVDSLSTTFAGPIPSQTSSSITFGGLEGNQLTGGFDGVSILGQSGYLRVLGSTTAAPASQFTITLYDSAFNTALYTGGAWTQLNTGGTILTFASQSGGFDFANVIGLDLNTASAGAPQSIGATLTRLETIPEPSRAMLLGLGILGLGMRRRRAAKV